MDRVTVPTKFGPMEIIFRCLDDPLPFHWAPKVRWQVEAFSQSVEHPPEGVAWVLDFSPRKPPDSEETHPPFIEWIRVFHGCTRCGVATALVDGARRRWPSLELSCAVTKEGEAFVAFYLDKAAKEGRAGREFAERCRQQQSSS